MKHLIILICLGAVLFSCEEDLPKPYSGISYIRLEPNETESAPLLQRVFSKSQYKGKDTIINVVVELVGHLSPEPRPFKLETYVADDGFEVAEYGVHYDLFEDPASMELRVIKPNEVKAIIPLRLIYNDEMFSKLPAAGVRLNCRLTGTSDIPLINEKLSKFSLTIKR